MHIERELAASSGTPPYGEEGLFLVDLQLRLGFSSAGTRLEV